MSKINHCDNHRVYQAGCEPCLLRSREYRRTKPTRRVIKTAYGPREHWDRMTEIGLRYEQR